MDELNKLIENLNRNVVAFIDGLKKLQTSREELPDKIAAFLKENPNGNQDGTHKALPDVDELGGAVKDDIDELVEYGFGLQEENKDIPEKITEFLQEQSYT